MYVEIHGMQKFDSIYYYFYSIFNEKGRAVKINQFSPCGETLPSEEETSEWKQSILEQYEKDLQKKPLINKRISVLDNDLINLKNNIKELLITYIKENDTFEFDSFKSTIIDTLNETAGIFLDGFLQVYINEAFSRQLIPEATLTALVDYIKNTSLDDLRSLT
jgi:hypothetical protein